MRKIDIYSHIMPRRYLELMKEHARDPGLVKRMSNLRMLWDMDARMEMLSQWPEVQQVLTLALPPPEALGNADQSPGFARVANDDMAAIVARSPKVFPAFVAALPMNNVPAALEEMDRAVTTLGARGIQVTTSVNGRPLDDPEFFPVFERATRVHGIPVWMHPFRPASQADYPVEDKSRFEIWQVLGWPYATSVAMARMVFSQMFDRLPELRIITHHCGAMIPYFGGRAETLWAQLGSRSVEDDYNGLLDRMVYADTVLGGSASALRCGLDFFGSDKVVFASDCPFDPEEGPMFIREGIRSIESLDLAEDDKKKIYLLNALKLLGLDEDLK
ncbi:MAG: amidohydrolase [Bordetella sp. SCN 68-11]|nr:MAG: amidohydrolase [Bordetella sp. SCN 68-11]